jgi:hypothetical protein
MERRDEVGKEERRSDSMKRVYLAPYIDLPV